MNFECRSHALSIGPDIRKQLRQAKRVLKATIITILRGPMAAVLGKQVAGLDCSWPFEGLPSHLQYELDRSDQAGGMEPMQASFPIRAAFDD